jgi:hypothetical protein
VRCSVVVLYRLANVWFKNRCVIRLGITCEFGSVPRDPRRTEKLTNTAGPMNTALGVLLIGFH